MAIKKLKSKNPLWTRDFTIITIGSVISMFGNTLSGYAMSLLVLDYTNSNFLYAIYISLFTLPQLVMPIFAGALLDRFSRKATIHNLDFISSGLYIVVGGFLFFGYFNFVLLAIVSFIIGSIESIYMVAYSSFYPLLISEGNFQRAYSISSVLETITALMLPVSALLYNSIGIGPLFFINSVCFLIAAILEVQIKTKEEYVEEENKDNTVSYGRRMLNDIKQGFSYLLAEKGLLAIAAYFVFSAFAAGASSVIVLPYFKNTFENGEYLFTVIMGMSVIGRAIGGLIHYLFNISKNSRFAIALFVYIFLAVIEGLYLYTTLPIMIVCCFVCGLLGVTSYTIRVSATQSYVPNEKKGRFNGAFNVLNTAGELAGELLAGALMIIMDCRLVQMLFMLTNLLAAIIIIGGNKKQVKPIYNTQN